jgi:hypothetical protein
MLTASIIYRIKAVCLPARGSKSFGGKSEPSLPVNSSYFGSPPGNIPLEREPKSYDTRAEERAVAKGGD